MKNKAVSQIIVILLQLLRFAQLEEKINHFWLSLVTRKFTLSSGCSWSNKKYHHISMYLAYALISKTNHLGNRAVFQFSLNSFQIF